MVCSWAVDLGGRLRLQNVTDYSQRGQLLTIFIDSVQWGIISPGSEMNVALEHGSSLLITVGRGTRRRELLRLALQHFEVGSRALPVLTSEGVEFRFPPSSRSPESRVRFLGVWIPTTVGLLAQHLRETGSAISCYLSSVDLRLKIAHDPETNQLEVQSDQPLVALAPTLRRET